jgi:hypothetical protein
MDSDDFSMEYRREGRKQPSAHMSGCVHEKVRTCPHKQRCSQTHQRTTPDQADGRMAWVHRRPRICTHALSHRTPNTPASPYPCPPHPRRGAWALASRRLCQTPAKRRPPVRYASPPPHTIHPRTNQKAHARTHGAPSSARPQSRPATLPHARMIAAPPVSWQHVALPPPSPRTPPAPPLPHRCHPSPHARRACAACLPPT